MIAFLIDEFLNSMVSTVSIIFRLALCSALLTLHALVLLLWTTSSSLTVTTKTVKSRTLMTTRPRDSDSVKSEARAIIKSSNCKSHKEDFEPKKKTGENLKENRVLLCSTKVNSK